VKFRVN